MKEKDYIQSVQTLFDFICGYFGVDWEEVMNRQRVEGTLGSIRMQHALFDMYKHIQGGENFLAWEKGIDMLKTIIDEWNEWKTSKDLRRHAQFLCDAADFMDSYESVRSSDRMDWLEQLRSMYLLTPEEKQQEDLVDKCPRSLNEDVFKAFTNKRMMRMCRYKGDKSLNMDNIKSVNIGENFILANNVGDFMMRGKDGRPDELNIYVALNIDDILDFSYFLIAFNNGENWWFLTDEPDFANPGAKNLIAGRGACKYRERDYDNTIFPYIFLDRIEEWRKNNTQLDKDGELKREMYTVPLTDWPVVCRVMLNLLIERVVKKLASDTSQIPVMKFGYEYTNTLLLEDKNLKTDEWREKYDSFEYAKDNHNARTRAESFIFKKEDVKALVSLNTKDLANKIAVWNSSLMTEEKYRQLEAWAVCESEYQRRKRMLENIEGDRQGDRKRMGRMLDRNFHNRIETLFAARNMYVFIYEPDMIYKDEHSCFNHNRGVIVTKLHTPFGKSWSLSAVDGVIGGDTETLCRRCDKHPLKKNHTSVLNIHHYSFLAWLAGVKREELPYWFINYESHLYESYTGNHLLNNINPVLLLKDGLSRRNPNGITIDIRVCQRCRTAMEKQAMEKGVLVINKLTCESEGVFEFEAFKTWLAEKGIAEGNALTYF